MLQIINDYNIMNELTGEPFHDYDYDNNIDYYFMIDSNDKHHLVFTIESISDDLFIVIYHTVTYNTELNMFEEIQISSKPFDNEYRDIKRNIVSSILNNTIMNQGFEKSLTALN